MLIKKVKLPEIQEAMRFPGISKAEIDERLLKIIQKLKTKV